MASSLTVFSWNSNSIRTHGEEFEQFIHNFQPHPDIICLQETFLKPAMTYDLQGYDIVRNDRIERNCGGVATLIRQGISYAEVDSGKGNIEYITIEINMLNRKLKISNIYCPPDKNPKSHEFQRFFSQRKHCVSG